MVSQKLRVRSKREAADVCDSKVDGVRQFRSTTAGAKMLKCLAVDWAMKDKLHTCVRAHISEVELAVMYCEIVETRHEPLDPPTVKWAQNPRL